MHKVMQKAFKNRQMHTRPDRNRRGLAKGIAYATCKTTFDLPAQKSLGLALRVRVTRLWEAYLEEIHQVLLDHPA